MYIVKINNHLARLELTWKEKYHPRKASQQTQKGFISLLHKEFMYIDTKNLNP